MNTFNLNYLQNNKLHLQIASQCAPLIYGIKVSNLLITDSSNADNLMNLFRNTTVDIYNLYHNDEKKYFLLYDQEKLEEYLKKPAVVAFMKKRGISDLKLEHVLSVIAQRYRGYKEGSRSFPHELGIVLGYPVKDVTGFIKNSGQNYMLSGYWKVYHNPLRAMKTFSEYKGAKENLTKLILEGNEIHRVIEYMQNHRIQNQIYNNYITV